jgi:hypothetical protein
MLYSPVIDSSGESLNLTTDLDGMWPCCGKVVAVVTGSRSRQGPPFAVMIRLASDPALQ